jgi:hypothetical protein
MLTNRQLVRLLKSLDPDKEVMIIDGENGGGYLRSITLGPTTREIQAMDGRVTADCEGREGETVIALGFGVY